MYHYTVGDFIFWLSLKPG